RAGITRDLRLRSLRRQREKQRAVIGRGTRERRDRGKQREHQRDVNRNSSHFVSPTLLVWNDGFGTTQASGRMKSDTYGTCVRKIILSRAIDLWQIKKRRAGYPAR